MNLMKAIWRFVASSLVLTMLLAQQGTAGAQPTDVQFFPETGHNIKGDFLRFYTSVRDPKMIFGYPITEQIASRDGKTVQYFQRARFELRADLPESQRVQLTPLGQATYQAREQLPLNDSAGCEMFSTGFTVCFAFLDFFNANGGTAQFGNPISPFEFHENLIVQYFEKARFEWRADRPEGQRVVLTDLGRLYFDQFGEDAAHLKSVNPLDATINPILSMKVRAFVARSVTRSTGQQTVYVIVQNQTGQAVSNMAGQATIHWPAGGSLDRSFITNSSGVGTLTFDFEDQKPGELVTIDIVVSYEGLPGRTRTSFRIWF
ncbi:MAG: hypothetical protein EHM40_07640 [Chloroflexi bacterium]|nr:MAG: hypothetical protein EHM40_07640 [Chloroflexota bacterium]